MARKKQGGARAGAGRPSEYTVEIAQRIIDQLPELSLRKICMQKGMPTRNTVVRWQDADPEFDAKCARARIAQADYMDDLILDTANSTTESNAQAARVKIGAYQWRAARLKPKRYGDKLDLNVAGQEGGAPIRTLAVTTEVTDPVEAARLYQEMIQAGKSKE
jgi:hypothetical protein